MFPPDRVAATLQQLAAKHWPVLIHLLDNALSPTLMERLSLQPPGAPWYGFARITPHLADKDFCMGLRRSGCVMLQLGLESGDQEVLDHESKGISLQTASDVLKTLNATGIATYVYLLFGTPSETPEAAIRTLDYVAAHHQFIDFLNIAVFNLPIESSQAHRLQTSAFSEGDLSLYTGFVHPKGWDRRRIRQFLDKAFKCHPDIAPIVRKDPPSFTSNHAPFFCRSFRTHPGTKAGSTGCPPSRQEG
jgi:hypothetical protein